MIKELITQVKKVDATSPHINKLAELVSEYDLLVYIKKFSEFFITNEIINAEWFQRFEKGILKYLNIYTEGSNNLALEYKALNAVVIDCHLTADLIDDCCSIKVFGKGYLEAHLAQRSTTSIKLYGKSKAEVFAKDLALARITVREKADLRIQKANTSQIKVENLTRKAVEC